MSRGILRVEVADERAVGGVTVAYGTGRSQIFAAPEHLAVGDPGLPGQVTVEPLAEQVRQVLPDQRNAPLPLVLLLPASRQGPFGSTRK